MALETKKIQEYDDILWDAGSPVLVEKMKLSQDLIRGVNLLSITFRNVSQSSLYGLSIIISMRDKAGKKLPNVFEYNYYALDVPQSKSFGTDTNIIVEPEARIFQLTVVRAEFEEMLPFRDEIVLKKIPDAPELATLGEFEEEFTNRFHERKPRIKLLCAPEEKQTYWRCVCKRIYPPYILKCPACRISHDDSYGILKELKAEKAARLREEALAAKRAEEEAERLRLEEEERLRLEEEKRLREEEERLRLEEEERLRKEEEERLRLEKKKKLQKQLSALAALTALIAAAVFLIPKKPAVPEEAAAPVLETTEAASEEATTQAASEAETAPVSYGTPIAVIGSDLSEEDQRIVLRLIGMTQEDYDQFRIISITNEEEHQYLDERFGRRMIGSRSLSCLLLTPTAPGSGLNISMYNISYCTEDMYREALTASGITDADVVIAGPSKTTGTSALTGCMMISSLTEELESTVPES